MTDLERARAIRKKLMYLASEIEDCAIIAAALKAEREQEREACLKIVQDTADTPGQGHGFIVITAQKLADRIRARGEP